MEQLRIICEGTGPLTEISFGKKKLSNVESCCIYIEACSIAHADLRISIPTFDIKADVGNVELELIGDEEQQIAWLERKLAERIITKEAKAHA